MRSKLLISTAARRPGAGVGCSIRTRARRPGGETGIRREPRWCRHEPRRAARFGWQYESGGGAGNMGQGAQQGGLAQNERAAERAKRPGRRKVRTRPARPRSPTAIAARVRRRSRTIKVCRATQRSQAFARWAERERKAKPAGQSEQGRERRPVKAGLSSPGTAGTAGTTTGQAGAPARLGTSTAATLARPERQCHAQRRAEDEDPRDRHQREQCAARHQRELRAQRRHCCSAERAVRAGPAALVEINPGWRSYEYFVVQEEIIIVDPRSRRIIAVLPV